MKKRIYAAMLFACSFCSCYYDKEDYLYGTSPCNSSGSSFSTTVLPILNQRCNSCHSSNAASSAGGGIILDNYNSVKNYVPNGSLLGSIKHSSGYSPMPKGGGSLTACEIAKVTDWVNNGAPNN